MTIRQINGTYSDREDRLQLRISTINSEEYRLLLTRRLSLILIHQLRTISGKTLSSRILQDPSRITTPEVSDAVAQFKMEGIRQEETFSEPYEEGANHPLGEDAQLVVGLTLTPKESLFALGFMLGNDLTLTVNLSVEQIYRLVLLIERLAINASWGLVQKPHTPSTEAETATHGTKRH